MPLWNWLPLSGGTLYKPNLATTVTKVLDNANTTPATVGVPVQIGPIIASSGAYWSGGVSNAFSGGFHAGQNGATGDFYATISTKTGAGVWTAVAYLRPTESYINSLTLYTGIGTFTKDAIVTTVTTGLLTRNTTAATVGVPVQYGPAIVSSGTAWDTGGAGSSVVEQAGFWVQPVSDNPASAAMRLGTKAGAGAWTIRATVDATGVTSAGSLYAGSTGANSVFCTTFAQINDAVMNIKANASAANAIDGIRIWNYAGTRVAGNLVAIGDGAAFTEKAAFNYLGALTISGVNAIGTAQTAGLTLQNTTAAAAGAQQYSPMLVMSGQGWKTDAVAASQAVDFGFQVRPSQGTVTPCALFDVKYRLGGGAWSAPILYFDSSWGYWYTGGIFAATVRGSAGYGALQLVGGGSTAAGAGVTITAPVAHAGIAGVTQYIANVTNTFSPASGATKFIGLGITPTINQTGTASGDYTALEINVTETAALGTNKLLFDAQLGTASKFNITSLGAMTETYLAIGTAQTAGLTLQNTTAAAAGSPQYSPMLVLSGQGWKTDAGGASQAVDFCQSIATIQGTAAPTGALYIMSRIAGAAWASKLIITTNGVIKSRGGRVEARKGLIAGDFPYTVSVTGVNTDYEIYSVTDCSAARVINLPTAASAEAGRVYVIKDESGACTAVNTISITPNGAETIDGAAAAYVLSSPYSSIQIYSNGTAWFVY